MKIRIRGLEEEPQMARLVETMVRAAAEEPDEDVKSNLEELLSR